MAETKKTTKNVFISIGLVGSKLLDGTSISIERYIVMSEKFATYIGATFQSATPPARKVTIKKGKLAGRIKSIEYSGTVSGRKYHLGYYDDKVPVLKKASSRRKIVWVPVHVPRFISTALFLKLFIPKITKKPVFLKTPDGMSTRFTNVT